MIWLLWFLLLVAQNAAFTLVSRARNSSSIGYHAWASVLSNGVWFLSNLILVDNVLKVLREADVLFGLKVAAFYTVATMTGSIGMHWIALHKIERKTRS